MMAEVLGQLLLSLVLLSLRGGGSDSQLVDLQFLSLLSCGLGFTGICEQMKLLMLKLSYLLTLGLTFTVILSRLSLARKALPSCGLSLYMHCLTGLPSCPALWAVRSLHHSGGGWKLICAVFFHTLWWKSSPAVGPALLGLAFRSAVLSPPQLLGYPAGNFVKNP